MDYLRFIDSSASRRLNLPVGSGWWQLARAVAHLGDGQYVFGGLGVVYLLGWIFSYTWLRQAAAVIALAVLGAMLVVTLVKFAVKRRRPRPPGEFVMFGYDRYSFPSGHAARLAALAVGVGVFFPGLGWGVTLLALSVAAARLAVGVHYLSDVAAGLVIGALVAGGEIFLLLYFLPILP